MPAAESFPPGNAKYASTFNKGHLTIPPAKKTIVVTCMDARLEYELGFELGDAHFIRNAGGVVRDSLRSIVISQRLLGTREIAVVQHKGCGMLTFTTEQLREIVKKASPGNTEVANAVNNIDFLDFANLEESVKSDVKYLKENPLVLEGTEVTGWVYDVETGKVNQVV